MQYDFTRLTHVEVAKLWEEREQIFVKNELDLATNERIDSAGIAFLVQWAKSLESKKLTLYHAKKDVVALIKTFHLEPFFELKE